MKLELTKFLIIVTVIISRVFCAFQKISTRDVTKHENFKLLPHDVCGPINTDQRIFYGQRTGMFDYPWMALVVHRVQQKYITFPCSGSIINEFYILTAAHCIARLKYNVQLYGVRLGEYDLITNPDCEFYEDGREWYCAPHKQDFYIDTIHYHPNYSQIGYLNDIGLIRVNKKINFNEFNVKPICLPIGPQAHLRQKKVIVTGWGKTETSPRSPQLLQIALSLLSTKNCQNFYKNLLQISFEKHLCGYGGRRDACERDSGGPLQAVGLYLTNKTRYVRYRYIQYGIVSSGSPQQCTNKDIPGVYTRVDNYMDWILDMMKA